MRRLAGAGEAVRSRHQSIDRGKVLTPSAVCVGMPLALPTAHSLPPDGRAI